MIAEIVEWIKRFVRWLLRLLGLDGGDVGGGGSTWSKPSYSDNWTVDQAGDWTYGGAGSFGGTPESVCPYCLRGIEIEKTTSQHCEHCEQEISAIYAEQAGSIPGCPVEVVGLPGHGKTVYLYALSWVLGRIAPIWKDYRYRCVAATDPTRKRLAAVRKAQKTGEMPEVTPLGSEEVYLLLLHGMARWRERILMVRDCSGEAFEGFRFESHSLQYFARAPYTVMFVSLADLELDFGPTMENLVVTKA